MSTIEVVPNFETLMGDVVIDNALFGSTKQSYDADFHAEMQARERGGRACHYPDSRLINLQKMEQFRKERKNGNS